MRYDSRLANLQSVQSNTGELFQSLAQKLKAFNNQEADELDKEMAKKAKERGLIDAQGKTEITLRDGNTIADENWNKGASVSHLAAIKLDIAENEERIKVENPEPEAYSEVMGGYSQGLLEGVPESLQPLVKDELATITLKGRISANQDLRTAQLNEMRVNGSNAIDLIESQSLDAIDSMDIEESAKLQEQHGVVLDGMVAVGTITPAEAAKSKAELADNIDSGLVIGKFKIALDEGNDEKFLAKFSKKKLGNFFSPEKREKLLTQMLALRNRRDSISVIQKKESLKEINLYTKALANGFSPSKEETLRVTDLAKKAGMEAEFETAVNDINQIAFYGKTPASQRREKIDELAASGEVKDFEKWKALKNADAQITKAAIDDGYALAVKQGVIEPTELNYGNTQTFKERAAAAKVLSSHYGVTVSPLADAEVKGLIDASKQMTPDEKTALAMSINAMDNTKVLNEIAKKQAPLFAMVSAIGDTDLGKTIFAGQAEIDAGNVISPSKADYLSKFDDYVKTVYKGRDREAIREAVLSHYAATAGNKEFDSGLFKVSLRAVTGGIVKINDFSIELPRGVTEDKMDKFVNYFSAGGVEKIGGVDNRTNKNAAEIIRDSQWVSIGAGEYKIITPLGKTLFQNGKPLTIKYSAEIPDRMTDFKARAKARRTEAKRKMAEFLN